MLCCKHKLHQNPHFFGHTDLMCVLQMQLQSKELNQKDATSESDNDRKRTVRNDSKFDMKINLDMKISQVDDRRKIKIR